MHTLQRIPSGAVTLGRSARVCRSPPHKPPHPPRTRTQQRGGPARSGAASSEQAERGSAHARVGTRDLKREIQTSERHLGNRSEIGARSERDREIDRGKSQGGRREIGGDRPRGVEARSGRLAPRASRLVTNCLLFSPPAGCDGAWARRAVRLRLV